MKDEMKKLQDEHREVSQSVFGCRSSPLFPSTAHAGLCTDNHVPTESNRTPPNSSSRSLAVPTSRFRRPRTRA